MMNNNEKLTKVGINWYPGHMVKAQNEIKENLKLIDIVVEVLDARIPFSSRNPLITDLKKDKPEIVVLNKSDISDKDQNLKWKKYFEEQGNTCILTCANINDNIKKIIEEINKKGKEIYDKKYENKSVNIRPIYRVLIVGIPNVGKSTIINKIANRQVANVGNKPGVTKKKQWIRVNGNIELLDTPGLLWPRLDDKDVGLKLALTGNVKQEILDVEELAVRGIDFLISNSCYKEMFIQKYKLDLSDLDNNVYDILEVIGRKRGCLVSGGKIDLEKAANIFFEDFKSGKIGRITLDII